MTEPGLDGWRALSLLQPWGDAVAVGGKRLENRKWVHGSYFRGPLMLHTSGSMKRSYYDEVVNFLVTEGLSWRPDPFEKIRRGGIIAICDVDGVVRSEQDILGYDPKVIEWKTQKAWWMGGFALVLKNVRATPFIPCKGNLGFWRVPADIARQALESN